jgi:hypothetical protein
MLRRRTMHPVLEHGSRLLAEAAEHRARAEFEPARACASRACKLYAHCAAELRGDLHDADPHDADPHDADPHDADPHGAELRSDPHDADPHDADPHGADLHPPDVDPADINASLDAALQLERELLTAEMAHVKQENLRLRGMFLDGLDEARLRALRDQLELSLELVRRAHAEVDTSLPPELEELEGPPVARALWQHSRAAPGDARS